MSTLKTTTTVRLADQFGPVLAGRGEASLLRQSVEKQLASGSHVTLDFDGVLAASPSFADELFAKFNHGLLASGQVGFANVGPGLAAIARFVRAGRTAGE